MNKNSDNIQVIIRVRPFSEGERREDSKSCVLTDPSRPNCIILDAKPEQKLFNFDWVGNERTTQQDIFEAIGKSMVQTCLEGYNCCIFAYGQTGAGKTYTMQGRVLESSGEDISHKGLQPRVFDYIFALKAKDMQENSNINYLVSCTYLEIYNEQIMDLLEPVSAGLHVREDLKKGVYVEGLKEELVDSSYETIELLRKGALNRHVGSTHMNIESSRSHSLFTMSIERKTVSNGTTHVRTSKFHFVDLAGSERQKLTAAVGERLKEAGNINKSLSVLGQVINSLVEIAEGKQRHIRYRDSKLTFILKDSLGGNSKTSLIANISPASSSFSETLSTLKFAQRAKQIKNRALINEDSIGSVGALKDEIVRLKQELAQYKNGMMDHMHQSGKLSLAKLTPQKNSFPLENYQLLQQQSHSRLFEIEAFLRQSIRDLTENEELLQTLQNELAKKEEYINIFKSAVEFYDNNELQYRSTLYLHQSKIQRLSQALSTKLQKLDCDATLQADNAQLLKENSFLLEIVKNTPTVMQMISESLEANLHQQYDLKSSNSAMSQLKSNLVLLEQIHSKLDEVLNQYHGGGSSKSNLEFLEEKRKLQNELIQIKLDYNDQIDKLKFEILESKQKECEAMKNAEYEIQRHLDLQREIDSLRSSKQRDEENYQTRIQEIFRESQEILGANLKEDDLESTVKQLRLDNLQLKEQVTTFKEKQESSYRIYQEMEDYVKSTLDQRDRAEQKYRAEISRITSENRYLENAASSMESQLDVAVEDLKLHQREIQDLKNLLQDLYGKENEYKVEFDALQTESAQLREQLSFKDDELLQLKSTLENEKYKNEAISLENNKVQEEYDTLIQTFNYNSNELEQKKKLIDEMQIRINEIENEHFRILEEMESKKEHINMLEKQICNQNEENSPLNLALNKNVELSDQIKNLKDSNRSMEIELGQKDQDLVKAQTDISNLSASIQHYQEAYKTTLNNLEIRSNEQSEIQTILNSKIAEIVELEQELKKANDLVGLREIQNNEIDPLIKQIHKTIIIVPEDEDANNNKAIKTLLEEIKDASENRNNEVQTLANKLKLFEEKTENLEIEIYCLNQTIQQLQNEKSALEKLVHETQEEASNQLEDLMSQLQNKQTQIDAVKSQLHSLYLKATGVKDAQYISEEIDDIMSDLEKAILQKDQELNSLQLQAQELSTKIADLETIISQNEASFEERKDKIDQLTNQIDNLEITITKKQQEVDKQAADIAELENNLLQKDQSVQTLQKELEESVAKTSFMQAELNDAKFRLPDLESSLQKERSRKVGYKQIIKNLKEQLREEQNKTHEKETFVENFGQKEKFYTQQIDELTKQLNDALQAASGDQHKNKELSSKIHLLEKDVEEKSQLLKDYIKQMRQMQNKIDAQIGLIVDAEEVKKVRQENANLRSEVKKQEDLVVKLSTEATDYCNQQEQEINRIKESYTKLAKQYQIIQAEASQRTLETTKDKDEIKQLVQEIKYLKENEYQLRKAKEESEAKSNSLENEKVILLRQIDNFEKENIKSIGNSFKQKAQQIISLKEEGNKVKEENSHLQENFVKIQEKCELLQKKLDDLSKDPTKIKQEELIGDSSNEFSKLKTENKRLYTVISKIKNLLISSPFYRVSSVSGKESNDFNRITEGLDELIHSLVEKEKEIKTQSKDFDVKRQQYSIIEKELAVIKQKYQQIIANPDIEIINPPNNKDKENLLWSSATKSKRGTHDSHEKRTASVLSSGTKRTFEDLNMTSMNSSRTTVKDKPLIDINRCKNEAKGRIDSKSTFGRIRDTNAQQNLSDFLKSNLIVIDDNDEDIECPQEEIKKKIKSGN